MRTLVIGDLHLAKGTPKAVSAALARLLDAHPATRLVVAGDLFDFSADHPQSSVEDTLGAHASARTALARHLDRDGEIWLVGGNHDSEVSTAGFAERLARALGVRHHFRIRTTPWFFRLAGVHIEHGHLFDADNAPAHPLVQGAPSLGVRFVREFVAKTGAHAYLNRNDQKPLELFLSTFKLYGKRAPFVIYQYFHTAFSALAESGPRYRAKGEAERGEELVHEFARSTGMDEDEVRKLAALRSTPTLESFQRTFARLYLDRVLATVSIAGGATAFALGKRKTGAAMMGLGAIGLAVSWGIGRDRYRGAVHESLRLGAADVRAATGCQSVVFGHTHRALDEEGYANTGSFAFPEGKQRPFLEIEGSRLVRRHL
jgi:UDP-2,3-diacylglucosamine pyrophosphatase LpxH